MIAPAGQRWQGKGPYRSGIRHPASGENGALGDAAVSLAAEGGGPGEARLSSLDSAAGAGSEQPTRVARRRRSALGAYLSAQQDYRRAQPVHCRTAAATTFRVYEAAAVHSTAYSVADSVTKRWR